MSASANWLEPGFPRKSFHIPSADRARISQFLENRGDIRRQRRDEFQRLARVGMRDGQPCGMQRLPGQNDACVVRVAAQIATR